MPVLRKIIALTLNGNILTPDSTDAGISGEDGAVALRFAVPDDFDDLTVTLTAISNNGNYSEVAAAGGVAELPLSAALTTQASQITARISCTDNASVRKTADCVLRVKSSLRLPGLDPPITPSVYLIGTGGINAYQVVFISAANTVMAANATNITHAGRVVGIAATGGAELQQVSVQTAGIIKNSAWQLTAGEVYYLGAGGEITTVPPTIGFLQKIGVARSAAELFLQIGVPIIL